MLARFVLAAILVLEAPAIAALDGEVEAQEAIRRVVRDIVAASK